MITATGVITVESVWAEGDRRAKRLMPIEERHVVWKQTATVSGMADQHSPCSIEARFEISDWD